MLTKIELYRRGCDQCSARADASSSLEIRTLWATVGSSYRFLLQREERLEAEAEARDDRAREARITIMAVRGS